MASDLVELKDWLQLIRAEYDEQPGLRLTQSQVEDLWALDATVAQALLGALVSAGILKRAHDGTYVRAEPEHNRSRDARADMTSTDRRRTSPIAARKRKQPTRLTARRGTAEADNSGEDGSTIVDERADTIVTEEHIRVRAYYLYLGRRGRCEDPLDDWLRAERELATAANVI
jgi:hypothetical protein